MFVYLTIQIAYIERSAQVMYNKDQLREKWSNLVIVTPVLTSRVNVVNNIDGDAPILATTLADLGVFRHFRVLTAAFWASQQRINNR